MKYHVQKAVGLVQDKSLLEKYKQLNHKSEIKLRSLRRFIKKMDSKVS